MLNFRTSTLVALCLSFTPLIHAFIPTVIRTVSVETKLGPIKGVETTVTGSEETVSQYRGIPFAKPPVGDLRFRKPEPVEAWKGTLDATLFGPSCAQGKTDFFDDIPNKEQSEDCLHLNMYVPQRKDNEKLPVMVWIHGGGYSVGQGMFYNASSLAVEGHVIVITINYRLGIFGFYTLGQPESLGNYGLWDQIQALRWINQNIDSFGGDKDSVTIFGESAGGFSVSLLALIPENKGLFHRVIAQSGTSHSVYAMSPVAGVISNMLTKTVGCESENVKNSMECMRKISANDLLQHIKGFGSESDFYLVVGLGPVVDGELFNAMPQQLISDAHPEVHDFFKSLDFMAGTTNQEGSLLCLLLTGSQKKYNFNLQDGIPSEVFQNLIIPTLINTYFPNNNKIAEAISNRYTDTSSLAAQSMRAAEMYSHFFFMVPTKQNLLLHSDKNTLTKTYQYELARDDPPPFGPPMPEWFKGSGHADDLLYLFGMNIRPLQGKHISEEDLLLSTQMMKYWTNFAKTGNPNLPANSDLPVWPEFTPTTKLYLELNAPPQVKHNILADDVEFWTQTIPNLARSDNLSHHGDEL